MVGVAQQAIARAQARARAASGRQVHPVRAAVRRVPGRAATDAARSRGARQLQVRRLRGSVPRLARGDPRAARELPAALRRGAPTSSTSAAGAASSSTCSRRRHRARRHRSQPRDGRGLPRARARRHGSRRRRLPVDAARRVARRPLRGAGRRAPGAGYLLRFLELAFHKLRPAARSCSRR